MTRKRVANAPIHLDEYVRQIRTPENADEIAWFADCVRGDQEHDNFPLLLTAGEWAEQLEAFRILTRVSPAILRAAEGAVPNADGTVTVPIDEETALDLLLGPDARKQ